MSTAAAGTIVAGRTTSCPKCGNAVAAARIFCTNCGAPVALRPQSQAAPHPIPRPPSAGKPPASTFTPGVGAVSSGTPAIAVGLCPNCGKAPIDHAFCSFCGQERFVPDPPGAWSGAAEFLWEAYSVGFVLCRTLLNLAVPGRLTLRYVGGRTVDAVSPMKLYMVSFGWLSFFVTQAISSAGPAGFPKLEELETVAGWVKEGVAFFLPMTLFGVLRFIWGARREHYAFALHSYAFLAFAVLPAQGYFFHAAVVWIAVTAWRTYGRVDPATGTRGYSTEGLVARSAATTLIVGFVFLVVMLALSLLELVPVLVSAWLQQYSAGMR